MSRAVRLEMTKLAEKEKHTFMLNRFFLSVSGALNEIIWKNVVEPRQATDDNIIRRMRFACWVPKATHTHTHTHTHNFCFFAATVIYANAPPFYFYRATYIAFLVPT